MIPVDRANRKRAIATLSRAAGQIRDGKVVLVFPEGTRSVGADLGKFKKGGFMLAIESGVPIIPIGLAGTGRVLPPGWNKLDRSAVAMVVGPPIETEGMDVSDRARLMDRVRDAINAERRVAQALVGQEAAEE